MGSTTVDAAALEELAREYDLDEPTARDVGKLPEDSAYEWLVLLEEQGEERAAEALRASALNYDGPAYARVRAAQQEEDDFIGRPPEVEEGVLECRACGSKRTVSYTLQVAAGDEGTTVWASCVDCGKKWKS